MKAASSSSSVRAPLGLTAAAAAIGLVFLGPFAYVVWRNVELGTDLGSVLFDGDTLHPLSQSLRLGVAVAISAAVIGTGLPDMTICGASTEITVTCDTSARAIRSAAATASS